MYSKILIISDNIFLCNKFEAIISALNLDIEYHFAISPYSNFKQFKSLFVQDLKIYDLTKEADVGKIIGNYDLVFSLHCKQLFPKEMVSQVKCINIHPGYNPINRGWYPQVFAIINDLEVGATIHEIDELLDHGPIIARLKVEKSNLDTSEKLYNKIVNAEITLIEENLRSIIENKYVTFLPEQEGVLYLKKDFNEVCKLDLDEMLTTRKLINKLRALTHGDFKNAYYIDESTGKKVFIKIELELEE
ncbi:dTDP-4-amino-4,6-dideoxyglucose formyltransferase [uncultured Algibacter sp.]|uniref:dTDP-4-amino-4,6-dideoxyglucose formyltransferase n=1 Tax=uncultured Algibacter sp. TaxID=298659 RepID=UPI002638FFF0|nr:dTDP-4-amino-4,6-dideoxyglucose formyltransferase [uncultured Algibacter sp.]